MAIVKSFFLGILTAFFALVAEMSFSIVSGGSVQDYISPHLDVFVFIAVAIEEILKYAIIYKSFSSLAQKNEIIINSFLVGAGFAATEIAFNIYSQPDILTTSYIFLVGILLVHIITSVSSGYFIAKKNNIYSTTIYALAVNIIIHFLYNVAILYLF